MPTSAEDVVGSWFTGGSSSRVAWTIALGFGLGIFPILGITTILCALAAKAFHLKQGPMQLGNYAALPFQLFGLVGFLRIGERLLGAPHFEFNIHELLRSMPSVPESTARAMVDAQWHMIVGWIVVAPVASLLVGGILSVLLKRAALRLGKLRPGRERLAETS